jgi:hypothetical protein
MRNKEATTTRNAMNSIVEKAGIKPIIIIADNGSEFDGAFKSWCETEHIRLVHTSTYSPTSNAIIENFNGNLRKMMRECFVRHNNFNWIDHLDDMVENRNSTKHKTTKYLPNEIWTATNTPLKTPKPTKTTKRALPKSMEDTIKIETTEEKQEDAGKITKSKAKRDLDKYKDEKIKVGEKVRIAYKAISSEIRKVLKAGDKKKLVVLWTPEVYEITKIKKPKPYTLQKPQYITSYGTKPFWANELQRVSDDAKKFDVNANKLNKVALNENYVAPATLLEDRAPRIRKQTKRAKEGKENDLLMDK